MVTFHEHRATLVCAGDEDRATQGIRRSALARAIRADGDVVVDLADLVYADPSLMLDLAMLARRVRVRQGVLFIRRPQPQIRTLIEMVGLHRLPAVRLEGPTPALA